MNVAATTGTSTTGAGDHMYRLLVELWPMHRTLNSDDMERALELCGTYIGDDRYQLHAFKPRTDVYTWWIPERYHVREAWLEIAGERVADFAANPLHLLSYSKPHIIEGKLEDIRDHIWTNPSRPESIPWEFKYYERDWGFCIRHHDLERFSGEAPVKGVIDVEFGDEPFLLGDFYMPGETEEDILFLTNICHPAQVNDSLAGLVIGLEMARQLAERPHRRHGFRLLIVPETIGTIAWFARNEDAAARIRHAWFCEMVAHDNSFILQLSRQGDALIDRAFLSILPHYRRNGVERTGPFREVVASDEMVTNGPGFDIPTPSLTRWPYPEYHTSDDNPGIIKQENLIEALGVMMAVWDALEKNYYPRRTFKGPVMLSRYGLWVDWREDRELNLKIDKLLMNLEGDKSVIDIAFELGLPLGTVRNYVDRLVEADLVEKSNYPDGDVHA